MLRFLLALVSVVFVACNSDRSEPATVASEIASPSPAADGTLVAPSTPSVRPTVAAPASPPPEFIVSPATRSPDGELVAYVEFQFGRCSDDCAVVFERSNGIEVRRVRFGEPALSRVASAWAAYTIDAWLDDNSGVVLGGSCECDGGSLHPIVVVLTDGGVVDRGVSALMGASGAHVSPSGRFLLSLQRTEVAWGAGVGCAVDGSADLIELLTGEVVATIPDVGSALVDWEWLDGRNLAYARRALPDPRDGTCDQQLLTWKALPVEWTLLTIS